MRCLKPLLVLLGVALLPSACGTLPGGAPVGRDIVRESEQPDADFALYPVTRAFLPSVAQWPATGAYEVLPWLPYSQGPKTQIIQPGDTLSIQVWDSNENSLLTAPQQRVTQLQGMKVAQDGTIFMPYLGKVSVRNMTPDTAREELQKSLETIVPSAQVQLAVEAGDQNVIELVSGVQRPGRYPVASRGVTILSVLAEGGGIPDGMRNPVVRLQRGGQSFASLAQDLYRNPARDILLRGGDRIMVESDPRNFIIMGAAGSERTVPFEKAHHTLMEALSMGGGLLDSRADLRAVLVLRKYPARAVRADGKGPDREQMIFTFDLSTGDGLFAARSFAIHPDDVVLATESPLPAASSLLGLVGTVLGVSQRLGGG